MSSTLPTLGQCIKFLLIIAILICTQFILNATYFHCAQPNNSAITESTHLQSLSSNHSSKPRVVLTLTAVPSEIPKMVNETINNLLYEQSYIVDIIYLNIPYLQLRNKNALYPSTSKLREYFPQNKVIINRVLADAGPTTRYLGGIQFEKDPQTLILTMDHDTWNFHNFTIDQLVEYAQFDEESVWTVWGENILWNPKSGYWAVDYWRYPLIIDKIAQKSWNKVEIFRAVNGVAFRRKWFDDMWYNATDYDLGCFWTDDHWFSFNMERQNVSIKLIHDYEQSIKEQRQKQKRRLGTLTQVNSGLKSDPSCTIAIMQKHPNIWKNAREENATGK